MKAAASSAIVVQSSAAAGAVLVLVKLESEERRERVLFPVQRRLHELRTTHGRLRVLDAPRRLR